MKIDAPLFGQLADIPERVRRIEEMEYDGAFSAEVANDPFLPLALAAEHSERIEIMTGIAVAFARNPMNCANIAHDLQAFTKGRFTLGIGSQIKPHIARRFSMPWSRPAARMREFILAMKAIWNCWYEGAPLDFRGDFYTHDLMTPMFVPPELRYGAPRVMLAAVGPRMAEVAGEVADAMLAHAFTTERYIREVTLPAVERGLTKAGRSRSDFEIGCPVFIVTGADSEARERSAEIMRKQIAFYGSTPAYRPVLELHGWGDLHSELHRLSKMGQWDEMGKCISDEVLETFAVVESPESVAREVRARYGDCIDRLVCTMELPDGNQQRAFIDEIRG